MSLSLNAFHYSDIPVHVHPSCDKCGKRERLSRCSKCKRTQYCSKKCQFDAWKDHKHDCKNWRAEAVDGANATGNPNAWVDWVTWMEYHRDSIGNAMLAHHGHKGVGSGKKWVLGIHVEYNREASLVERKFDVRGVRFIDVELDTPAAHGFREAIKNVVPHQEPTSETDTGGESESTQPEETCICLFFVSFAPGAQGFGDYLRFRFTTERLRDLSVNAYIPPEYLLMKMLEEGRRFRYCCGEIGDTSTCCCGGWTHWTIEEELFPLDNLTDEEQELLQESGYFDMPAKTASDGKPKKKKKQKKKKSRQQPPADSSTNHGERPDPPDDTTSEIQPTTIPTMNNAMSSTGALVETDLVRDEHTLDDEVRSKDALVEDDLAVSSPNDGDTVVDTIERASATIDNANSADDIDLPTDTQSSEGDTQPNTIKTSPLEPVRFCDSTCCDDPFDANTKVQDHVDTIPAPSVEEGERASWITVKLTKAKQRAQEKTRLRSTSNPELSITTHDSASKHQECSPKNAAATGESHGGLDIPPEMPAEVPTALRVPDPAVKREPLSRIGSPGSLTSKFDSTFAPTNPSTPTLARERAQTTIPAAAPALESKQSDDMERNPGSLELEYSSVASSRAVSLARETMVSDAILRQKPSPREHYEHHRPSHQRQIPPRLQHPGSAPQSDYTHPAYPGPPPGLAKPPVPMPYPYLNMSATSSINPMHHPLHTGHVMHNAMGQRILDVPSFTHPQPEYAQHAPVPTRPDPEPARAVQEAIRDLERATRALQVATQEYHRAGKVNEFKDAVRRTACARGVTTGTQEQVLHKGGTIVNSRSSVPRWMTRSSPPGETEDLVAGDLEGLNQGMYSTATHVTEYRNAFEVDAMHACQLLASAKPEVPNYLPCFVIDFGAIERPLRV
ncbi:unnamed protein product [Peniophora sp. CBMAI 1063]|nr:unnamed protein product [Peniophora sp. CBMAI 1063]